ncbi:MATE family efflux transporter [Halobacterium noricense]|nr:MATE family efflux transporter [Halobacterium noricense]UHH25039.1 MATE family efflux transporter [Halobacterium noricense]
MRSRLRAVWRRVFALAWPVMAEQTLRTLMRTVDVVVTAAISPAAVVAVGIADLYARFPLRVGLGLGGGAISLSSQDTGRDATVTRDEAITQAVLVGALAGLPFAAFGVLFGPAAIRLLGAAPDVVALGSTYLAIILLTAPARHVALIAARALQGTGDTRTPMYVNAVSNLGNVAGSVGLGLGYFGLPELGVVGVGAATAAANTFTAVALTIAIASSYTAAGFARPRSRIITKQLFAVSLPKIAEGGVSALAEFPFNALLLSFGTNVNAAFQIGRRVYQQVTGPLSRGYNVAANVVVGQALGGGDPGTARFDGWAVAALGVLTVGAVGLLLSYYARPLVALLADEPETVRHGVWFARAYGLSAPFLAAFVGLSGALQGASETRVPFVARATGMLGFLVGFSWLAGRTLDYGPVAAYWGIALSNVWMAAVVATGFHYGGWASRAASMMAERSDA